jgi:Cof subfamily protein (haloacid dehalogenase superfamily)
MKSYKMIALDLDGTLLDGMGNVTERSRAAVRAALDAGLLVCFATGRNWTESKVVLDAISHYDSAVFVGGAMVVDTKNEVVLHRTLMDPQLAREVSAFLEDRGECVLALLDTTVAGVDYLISAGAEMNVATKIWMDIAHKVIHQRATLADYPHEHTMRLGFVASPEVAEPIAHELEAKFGERIVWHSIGVPSHNVHVIEVFDPAVNKWEGITFVARRHGIKPEEIVAVGDDVNDLPMLKHAGLGVAMGNAKPEVKALAKRVIGTNREEGLAEFLEEIVAHHVVRPLKEIDSDANAS